MTQDWTDHALRQLWAEGINWRALASSGVPHVEAWLQCRDTLPRREPFHYPGPEQVRIGAPLMALFVDAASLFSWAERLCGGALQGIGAAQVEDGQLDRVAHWRLNLALDRGFSTPERVVQRWADHPDQVQDTPAEQQILAWYRNHESWLGRWHPDREGSGAMRRAPIWGAIYGALHWRPASDPKDLGTILEAAGWDVPGNQLVAGAFRGRGPRPDIEADSLNGLVHTVVSAHGHPPHG